VIKFERNIFQTSVLCLSGRGGLPLSVQHLLCDAPRRYVSGISLTENGTIPEQ